MPNSRIELISAPLEVPVSKKNKFILNLNNYRNTHFQVLNKAKKVYKEHLTERLLKLQPFNTVTLEFILYPKSNRLTDLDNVTSIHAKFFQDALTETGVLPDDNYNYVISTTSRFGYVDKNNPRVDIIIKEIEPMNVTVIKPSQEVIIEALTQYFNFPEGLQVEFDLGNQSEPVNTHEVVVDESEEDTKPKRKRRTKAEMEQETKPEPIQEEVIEPVVEEFTEAVEESFEDREMSLIDEVLAEAEGMELPEIDNSDLLDTSKSLFG